MARPWGLREGHSPKDAPTLLRERQKGAKGPAPSTPWPLRSSCRGLAAGLERGTEPCKEGVGSTPGLGSAAGIPIPCLVTLSPAW